MNQHHTILSNSSHNWNSKLCNFWIVNIQYATGILVDYLDLFKRLLNNIDLLRKKDVKC